MPQLPFSVLLVLLAFFTSPEMHLAGHPRGSTRGLQRCGASSYTQSSGGTWRAHLGLHASGPGTANVPNILTKGIFNLENSIYFCLYSIVMMWNKKYPVDFKLLIVLNCCQLETIFHEERACFSCRPGALLLVPWPTWRGAAFREVSGVCGHGKWHWTQRNQPAN